MQTELLQRLREELEIALVKAERQRRELVELRQRTDQIMAAIQRAVYVSPRSSWRGSRC